MFRRVFLGRLSTPWQAETAHRIVELLATDEKEFVVENCPPGVGKTTLEHDVAAWVTARDRGIRGLFGSRAENNARRQLRRLKRTLERTSPPRGRAEDVARGLAVDAELCLAVEFGAFRPPSGGDVWSQDEFVVWQLDDQPIEEKEPTWSCYGMDSAVLSNRFNLIFWDDVVDKTTVRTMDGVENQRQWWDDEGETRLEPGGLLWLVGQRYASVDLYRYALDKAVPVDEDEDGEDVGETRPQYHHVVFRAHYDDRCSPAFHKRDAPPYPEGCLLDPYRLPWGGSGGLRAIQRTKPTTYQVQYQQEDTDPEGVLVPELWILGGIDPVTGEQYPGCWDEHRGLAELPDGLIGPKVSVATVDPSGKKMWALEWWVHTPAASSQSFLMDLERKAMPANELLDWDQQSGRFTGLMEEWQARSVRLRVPISHWVVEVNAAQRYLLAYDHVRRWQRKWGVAIIPHTTGPRKLDPDHGPWTIREHFHSGRVRLPGRQGPLERARIQSVKLVTEVTHWPNAGYSDDCVMACWFFFTHLPKLIRTSRRRVDQGTLPRPSWMLASA